MADISRELAAIRNAVYGEEVRGSIIAALEKINEDSGSGGETVDIDADDLGLVQNEITEYVYPTYKGTASSHGIRISGGGESSSDYIFYYIFYYNYDGSELLHIDVVDKGEDGDYNGTPERPSSGGNAYTFVGWSTSKNATTAEADCTKNVTEDKRVYAAYAVTVSSVELKYYNYDGSQLLNTETVAYGGDGTYSATPARASTAQYDYTFVGWSTSTNATSATANVTKNLTADKSVYAAYSRATKTYVLTYYNYNGGSSLYTEILPYGKNGTYSGTPTRASTAQYTYTFIGWSTTKNSTTADANAIKNLTSDRSVYAVYSQQTRTYSLKYYNYDGTQLINTDTVAYGGNGTYTGTPSRASDSQYSYTFVGWSTSMNATSATANATQNITADKSVYAAYSRQVVTVSHTLNYYNYDGSSLLNSETVVDGGNGTYSGTPSRASTAQYTYTFVGWSTSMNATSADANATKNITADKNVYAAYITEEAGYTTISASWQPNAIFYTGEAPETAIPYLIVSGTKSDSTVDTISDYTITLYESEARAEERTVFSVGTNYLVIQAFGKWTGLLLYAQNHLNALPSNAITLASSKTVTANDMASHPFLTIYDISTKEDLGVDNWEQFNNTYFLIIEVVSKSALFYTTSFDTMLRKYQTVGKGLNLTTGLNSFEGYYLTYPGSSYLARVRIDTTIRDGEELPGTITANIYAVPRS